MSERVPGCCEEAAVSVEWCHLNRQWHWTTDAVDPEEGVLVRVEVEMVRCPYCGAALPDVEKK